MRLVGVTERGLEGSSGSSLRFLDGFIAFAVPFFFTAAVDDGAGRFFETAGASFASTGEGRLSVMLPILLRRPRSLCLAISRALRVSASTLSPVVEFCESDCAVGVVRVFSWGVVDCSPLARGSDSDPGTSEFASSSWIWSWSAEDRFWMGAKTGTGEVLDISDCRRFCSSGELEP